VGFSKGDGNHTVLLNASYVNVEQNTLTKYSLKIKG
jgi:hypothetical protein